MSNSKATVTTTAHQQTNGLIDEPERYGSIYLDVIRKVNLGVFSAALRQTAGNVSAAADLLGINRATLRTKVDYLGGKDKVMQYVG